LVRGLMTNGGFSKDASPDRRYPGVYLGENLSFGATSPDAQDGTGLASLFLGWAQRLSSPPQGEPGTMNGSRDITVLGLGNMGSALANALISAGNAVTVWNRDTRKSAPFKDRCSVAADSVSACKASDMVIICISNFAASRALLLSDGMAQALAGRTLVQLTTGSIYDTREFAAWAKEEGIALLDGKIGCVPAGIGASTSVIFYAGDRSLFDANKDVLSGMAGKAVYAGSDIANAAILDFAFLSFYFPAMLGVLHGAAICEGAGIDTKLFFDAMPSFSIEVNRRTLSFDEIITNNDYLKAQSTLETDLAGAQMLYDCTKELGLDARFVQSLLDVMNIPVKTGQTKFDTAYNFLVYLKRGLPLSK
jgi:3-hydroxyisobutyrate dehydrogenase-like beta-hydroxyacid dehydrogenase